MSDYKETYIELRKPWIPWLPWITSVIQVIPMIHHVTLDTVISLVVLCAEPSSAEPQATCVLRCNASFVATFYAFVTTGWLMRPPSTP